MSEMLNTSQNIIFVNRQCLCHVEVYCHLYFMAVPIEMISNGGPVISKMKAEKVPTFLSHINTRLSYLLISLEK